MNIGGHDGPLFHLVYVQIMIMSDTQTRHALSCENRAK